MRKMRSAGSFEEPWLQAAVISISISGSSSQSTSKNRSSKSHRRRWRTRRRDGVRRRNLSIVLCGFLCDWRPPRTNWKGCKTRCKEAQGRAKRMGVNLDRQLWRAKNGG
jgi:hypothetical protein